MILCGIGSDDGGLNEEMWLEWVRLFIEIGSGYEI